MVSTATNSAGFLLASVIDESTPTSNINIRSNVNGNPRKNNDPVTSVNLATLNDSLNLGNIVDNAIRFKNFRNLS